MRPCCGKCCTKAKQKGLSSLCPKVLQSLGSNCITWVLRRTFRCSLNRRCMLLTLLSPCRVASLHLDNGLTQSWFPIDCTREHKSQRQTIPDGSDIPWDEHPSSSVLLLCMSFNSQHYERNNNVFVSIWSY